MISWLPLLNFMLKSAIVTQFLSEMRHVTASVLLQSVLESNRRGFRRRQAHLCVLAANCDEPMYVKLVEALCAEHQINLIKVRMQLQMF